MQSPLTPLAPWHVQADGSAWFRLQGMDRSMLCAPQLYLAASDGTAWAAEAQGIDLRADEWLGSGTLRNSFYVEPWVRLSTARELALVLDVQGSLRVRVMRAVRGKPAVVLRELTLEAAERSRHVLPLGALSALPDGSRLFWHLDAIDGARLHDAAWCTRSRPRERTGLAVLMRTWGRSHELQAQLDRFAEGARRDPYHAELLSRTQFWVLDSSDDAPALWPDPAAWGLDLRLLQAPNLGGGGNASHLIHHFLAACDADPEQAPPEVLILDDDLVLSMESLARHWMAGAYRSGEHITSLPVMMKSQPTQVWEDGGFWGRLNFQAEGEFGRRRNLFPHLLKHGLSLESFDHLDEFGALNHCEYTTFIFFALSLATLRRLGLPAAFFLRGDDIEFCLRAHARGVPVLTNPNLAAWHEPGHSHAQEYMAILHAVLINLQHSDGDAADLARFFEQRLAEHAALDDLEGLRLYLQVLDSLLDTGSPLLTPGFEAHYRATLPALQAVRMSPLPEGDRQRLEREAGENGVLLVPFLYPGYRPRSARHRAVVLVNAGAGSYRELPPADPAERLALMQRYLEVLARFSAGFEDLRAHWRARLEASGQPEFWAEVARRHAGATRQLAHAAYRRPAPLPDEAPAPAATPDALAHAVPVRELRQRIERELAQLARLRQATVPGAAAAAPEPPAPAEPHRRTWLRWWPGAPRASTRPGPRPRAADALPSDFDPALYLALNADVARTGIDAALHYTRFGRAEGRRYRL